MKINANNRTPRLEIIFNEQTNSSLVINGFENGTEVAVNGKTVIAVDNPIIMTNGTGPNMYENGNLLCIAFRDSRFVDIPDAMITRLGDGKVMITANDKSIDAVITNDGIECLTTYDVIVTEEVVVEETLDTSVVVEEPSTEEPVVEEVTPVKSNRRKSVKSTPKAEDINIEATVETTEEIN